MTIEEYVRQLVDQCPPLTHKQIASIRSVIQNANRARTAPAHAAQSSAPMQRKDRATDQQTVVTDGGQ